jgi:hypothetical protein
MKTASKREANAKKPMLQDAPEIIPPILITSQQPVAPPTQTHRP